MEQFMGCSQSGNLEEAVRGLKDPKLCILCVSDKNVFNEKVQQLEQLYPGVPSIGCVGQSYAGTQVLEKGLMVTAFCGDVTVVTGVLKHVSKAPVSDVKALQKSVERIHAGQSGTGQNNTVLIDFCTGNDECVLTTFHSVLQNRGIELTGGTAWEGLVCCNGEVFEDACVYALVRNDKGKIKVYKENLYTRTDKKHIITKSVPEEYVISEIDGKPAELLYEEELGISANQITDQTFMNPFGRCVGDEIYIISIKEYRPDHSLVCFRKANPKDIIYILEKGDHEKILGDTITRIQNDFPHISGVFSINCLFRYLYFQKNQYVHEYFSRMEQLGPHSGMIGLGEHYNAQHTNQTMSCVVFE